MEPTHAVVRFAPAQRVSMAAGKKQGAQDVPGVCSRVGIVAKIVAFFRR